MLTNKIINIKNQKITTCFLYLLITCLSIILSLIAINNSMVNNDGILYIDIANTYLSDGYAIATKKISAFPLYAILMAYISKIFNISLLNSAYLINTILQALVVLSFIHLFRKLNPNNTQLLFAIIIIFIFPYFNDNRHDLSRDCGFWAFSLMGINNLISYYKYIYANNYKLSNKLFTIFAYFICFAIATLFRVEAIILAAVIPLSLLFIKTSNKNIKNNIKLTFNFYKPVIYPIIYCALIFVILLLLYYLIYTNSDLNTLKNTNTNPQLQLLQKYNIYNILRINIIYEIADTYKNNIAIINNTIFKLGDASFSNGLIFIIFGILAVFIIKYIKVFNIVNLILFFIFLFNFKKISKTDNNYLENANNLNLNIFRILFFIFIISIIIPLLFLTATFIISGRYIVLSCFMLMLFIPFSMDYIYKTINTKIYNNKSKYSLYIISSLILIIVFLSGILSTGYSKEYIRQAGVWYKQQQLPNKNLALSNNIQTSFYAGLKAIGAPKFEYNMLTDKDNNTQYFLLKIKGDDKKHFELINQLEKNNNILILKTFSNKKADTVIIIRKKQT